MARKKKNDFKNIFITVGVLVIVSVGIYFYLSMSTQNANQLEEAKQSLGINTEKSTDTGYDKSATKNAQNDNTVDAEEEQREENDKKFEEKEQEAISKKITTVTTNYPTDTKVLTLNEPNITEVANRAVELTGTTNGKIDKIIVNFSNVESKFPDDRFELKKFKAGDETFLYRAFEKYETIDYGKNVYVFEAYIGDEVEKMEVIIDLVKPEETVIDLKEESLPETVEYGNPVDLGEGKISYSDIRGLEIEKIATKEYTCSAEDIATISDEKISGYSWWNTCRPFSDEKAMSYFVTRISGEDMIYEKTYVTNNGYYAVYELKKETGVILENDSSDAKVEKLKQKSAEYKKLNADFEGIARVDTLMGELSIKQ